MKIQNAKLKAQNRGIITAALIIPCLLLPLASTYADEPKWSGVDETIVEKYAKEHNREAKAPFINTDQGDLFLFVFLLAGAAAGFLAGYYWKTLIIKKAGD